MSNNYNLTDKSFFRIFSSSYYHPPEATLVDDDSYFSSTYIENSYIGYNFVNSKVSLTSYMLRSTYANYLIVVR